MSGALMSRGATSACWELGSWSYSVPQCRATTTTSAPRCRAVAASARISCSSISLAQNVSLAGYGIPLKPYV